MFCNDLYRRGNCNYPCPPIGCCLPGPAGAPGIRGATGATGIQGVGTTIVGTASSKEQLDREHPNGPATDAYIVNGEIYIWSAEEGWHSGGSLIGPTGATGETGTGTTIVGTGTSKEQLDTDHPNGPATDAYLVNGEIYIWNETDGWHSGGSLVGPTGATGTGTTIKGTGVSKEQLDNDYPNGPETDAYLVDGEIYIWNETDGWHSAGSLIGPTGPTGPAATGFSMIPFASTIAPYSHTSVRVPTRVSLIGFGYGDSRGNAALLLDYSVPLLSDGSFDLSATDNYNFQIVFSLPFDVTLDSIFTTTGNWALFDPDTEIYHSVQIYQAPPTGNLFRPIPNAIAVSTPMGPGTVAGNTMVAGSVENLGIELTAGTRIAIGGYFTTPNSTSTYNYYFYYTGGLGFTRKP